MTRLVAYVCGRDKTPYGSVKAVLLIVGQVGKTILREAEGAKRLVKKRVGEIGRKRGEAGGTIHRRWKKRSGGLQWEGDAAP